MNLTVILLVFNFVPLFYLKLKVLTKTLTINRQMLHFCNRILCNCKDLWLVLEVVQVLFVQASKYCTVICRTNYYAGNVKLFYNIYKLIFNLTSENPLRGKLK